MGWAAANCTLRPDEGLPEVLTSPISVYRLHDTDLSISFFLFLFIVIFVHFHPHVAFEFGTSKYFIALFDGAQEFRLHATIKAWLLVSA